MKKTLSFSVMLWTAAPSLCFSQSAATGAPVAPPPGRWETWMKDAKNPVDWLSWGGDIRIRNEYFNNLLTLNPNVPLHEQDYFRFRARVWATVKPVEDVSLNVRLATEPREWMNPAGYTPMKLSSTVGKVGPDWTEGIVDNLNVQWKNILGQPASVTVGRQDIFLGDGWLVGDGTPYDGSWTYYLDAARASYEFKEQHTTVEAIGIIQDARDNGWLPPIADETQRRFETEQNEKGAILQVANSSLKAANVTGYFIYKHDDRANGADAPPRVGDDADIYTLGGRVTGLLGEHWKYWVEGAYQFGEKKDTDIYDEAVQNGMSRAVFRDLRAFGVNDKLTYLFKDKWNNQLSLCYEYLSGDNPNTKNDEMFDVLWGRWPHWSEIGLYSYAAETRIGQEANLHRIGPGWSFNPVKSIDVTVNYYALLADQQVPTRGAAENLPQGDSRRLFTDSGTFRGHFLQAFLKYKFNAHVSAHVWSEFLFPGDYYVHREMMSFLRGEMMFTF